MPTHIDTLDIVLRLASAMLAGGLLGLNREVKGHTAGLRTILLVCLAAALIMVMANLLLETRLPADSGFTTFDVLRLPLGFLSGVGMLGAGAIIHRSEAVKGVTTAASLWYATAVGLCIGAGLVVLGLAATAIGLVVLWGFRELERLVPQQARGHIEIEVASGDLLPDQVQARLKAAGYKIAACTVTYDGPERYALRAELHGGPQSGPHGGRSMEAPSLFADLARTAGVTRAQWSSAK